MRGLVAVVDAEQVAAAADRAARHCSRAGDAVLVALEAAKALGAFAVAVAVAVARGAPVMAVAAFAGAIASRRVEVAALVGVLLARRAAGVVDEACPGGTLSLSLCCDGTQSPPLLLSWLAAALG